MTRYLYKAILMIFLGVMLQACVKEYPNNDLQKETVQLNIGIITRVGVQNQISAGALGDGEYAISTLRIYAFEADGNIDRIYYQKYSAPIINNISVDFHVLKADSKDLFIVINEPTSISDTLDAITTAEELKGVNYTIAGEMNKVFVANATFSKSDYVIPMTAFENIDASADKSITVRVDRAVSRVDLLLDKSNDKKVVRLTSETNFTVNGVRYSSTLIEPESLNKTTEQGANVTAASASATLMAKVDDYSTAIRVLSLYTAERLYDYSDVNDQINISIDKLEVDGAMVSLKRNSVILGVDDDMANNTPITEINRNYVYKIHATYDVVKEEIVADNFEIIPWTYKVVDGNLPGVLFAVDLVGAMDWLRNGNSYTANVLAFGSNRPIEIYLPMVTGITNVVDGVNIPEYKYVKQDFNFTPGATYDLKSIGGVNSYIAATDWIEEATLVFTSSYSGYVRYKYKHSTVHYMLEEFPIRYKSENVIKDMVAVYDNGYIPCRFLPEHWQNRAPNGLVFSKRGRGKHPIRTEEIMFCDDNGYYTDEYKTTATNLSNYCTTELNPNWYVPTKDEMLKAQQGVQELGTSYRFQNCGDDVLDRALYWTSTPDTNIPGNYWAVDFTRGAALGSAVSMPESSELFVRCVVDLK